MQRSVRHRKKEVPLHETVMKRQPATQASSPPSPLATRARRLGRVDRANNFKLSARSGGRGIMMNRLLQVVDGILGCFTNIHTPHDIRHTEKR